MPMKKSGRARKPAPRSRSRVRARATRRAASIALFDRIRKADPTSLTVAVAGIVAVALVITGLASAPATSVAKAADTSKAQSQPAAPAKASTPASRAGMATTSNATPSGPLPTSKSATAPVTIAGCLERDGDTFRLRDASGTAVPQSRSWKSGFLRKGASPVAVHDPARRLNLTRHVGARVSVTGTLDGKAIRGSSLRRVSASCEEERQVKI